jgi:hypothetical protein
LAVPTTQANVLISTLNILKRICNGCRKTITATVFHGCCSDSKQKVAFHHSVQWTTWWEPWISYPLPLSFLPFALALTRRRGTLKSSQLRLHAQQDIQLGLPLALGHATWFQMANQISLNQKINFQENINKHIAKAHFMREEMIVNHVQLSSYTWLEDNRNVTNEYHARRDRTLYTSYHAHHAAWDKMYSYHSIWVIHRVAYHTTEPSLHCSCCCMLYPYWPTIFSKAQLVHLLI